MNLNIYDIVDFHHSRLHLDTDKVNSVSNVHPMMVAVDNDDDDDVFFSFVDVDQTLH